MEIDNCDEGKLEPDDHSFSCDDISMQSRDNIDGVSGTEDDSVYKYKNKFPDIFQCFYCNQELSSRQQIKQHLDQEHSQQMAQPSQSIVLPSISNGHRQGNNSAKSGSRTINKSTPLVSFKKCKYCYHETVASSLRTHLLCFHKINYKPCYCAYCDYSTNQLQDLNKHLKQHDHLKQYSCIYCNKYRTVKWNYLKRHVLSVHRYKLKNHDEKELLDQVKQANRLDKDDDDDRHDDKYTCSQCNHIALSLKCLSKHIVKNHAGSFWSVNKTRSDSTDPSDIKFEESNIKFDRSDSESNQSDSTVNRSDLKSKQSDSMDNQSNLKLNQSDSTVNRSDLKLNRSNFTANPSESKSNCIDLKTNIKNAFSKISSDTNNPDIDNVGLSEVPSKFDEFTKLDHQDDVDSNQSDMDSSQCNAESKHFDLIKPNKADCIKRFVCKKCNFITLYESLYNEHLACAHTRMPDVIGKRLLHCNYCSFTTLYSHSVRRHYDTVHFKLKCKVNTVKQFSCDYCKVNYEKKIKLRRHVERDHDVDKPFNCKICDYKAPLKADLVRHMRLHY